MKSQSQITKGAIISYVSIFLNIVISFVYTPWMIHKIGVSDYGLYNLSASFISYFILDFGMSSSIARFISKYRTEGNEEKVENLLGMTAKIYLAIDTIIFLLLFVLYFFIADIFTGLTSEEIDRFKIIYCIAGVFSVFSFAFKPVNGAMMAYEYFVENRVLDMVIRVGSVLFVCIALLCGGNVYLLVLINGAMGLLVSIAKYYVLIKKSHLKINWHFFEISEMKVLLSFSLWLFLMALAQRFRFTLVQSILGIQSNSSEISFFSVGMMIEGMVYTISAGLNGLFLPKVTRMSYLEDKSSVMELMIRVGRLELFLIALIFSGFFVFGKAFVHLWLGEEFHDVYYIVILLVASNVVSVTQAIANDYVMAINKVRTTAIFILISSSIGFVGSIILAPSYGAVGCAASTCFALFLNLVLVNVFYSKKLGLNVWQFFKECHLKILPLIMVLTILAYGIELYYCPKDWYTLIIAMSLYTITFVILAYFLLFNKYEKDLIKSLIKK